jgi:hypothetical protein
MARSRARALGAGAASMIRSLTLAHRSTALALGRRFAQALRR